MPENSNLKGRLQAIVQETYARNRRELSAEKVAWPIVDAIWPEIQGAIRELSDKAWNEGFRQGRTHALKGGFTAGDEEVSSS